MPKKIYLFDYNDAMVTPLEGDTVYVREDAFIEKAAEWIKNKAENYIVDTPLCSYFDYKRAVEDFKNILKENSYENKRITRKNMD